MGNAAGNNFKVWPLMEDELAPPVPHQHHSAIEDDTIIQYGSGEFTYGLQNLSQVDNGGPMAQDPRLWDNDAALEENETSRKYRNLSESLDEIIPQYMQQLEANESREHMKLQSKDEHQLMSLFEVRSDHRSEE